MKMTTLKEHSDLESIADATRLLQKEGYTIIDPDTMKRVGDGFELRRQVEADAYRRYISDRASYDHQ